MHVAVHVVEFLRLDFAIQIKGVRDHTKIRRASVRDTRLGKYLAHAPIVRQNVRLEDRNPVQFGNREESFQQKRGQTFALHIVPNLKGYFWNTGVVVCDPLGNCHELLVVGGVGQ